MKLEFPVCIQRPLAAAGTAVIEHYAQEVANVMSWLGMYPGAEES